MLHQLATTAVRPAEATTAVTPIPTADTTPTRLFVSATDKLSYQPDYLMTILIDIRRPCETRVVIIALVKFNLRKVSVTSH